ncbi:glycosyltransferase [Serratia proteamaculans]|uniref:glycosyltransferase n=1 Tax=Serratia proteamaculans TaxID=28151 RepID=UPI003CF80A09
MLKFMDFEEILNTFGEMILDSKITADDYHMIKSSHYGKSCNHLIYKDCVLFIGSRSGLEIILSAHENKNTEIHVIEKNNKKREILNTLPFENIFSYESFDDFFSKKPPQSIDLVRVDRSHFDYNSVLSLLDMYSVGTVCGEIDETQCKPINLYRECRLKSNNFFFRVKGQKYHISGLRKTTPQPEVSVVVAAYGVEQYLDECIGSIAQQTLQNIEILIVDDGSVDGTGKKADEWEKRFPDIIKVIHKENGGCASARLAGLKEAKGEFVAFVDGDDWVEKQMYEDLYESAALHNSDISQCGFYEFYSSETKIFHSTAWGADGQNGTSGLVKDTLEYLTLMPSIWRRIYKKSFLNEHRIEFPEHIRRHDDLPFAFLTMSRAKRISVIPDCYYAYRLNRPGQDVGATDERLFIHFEIFSWLFKQVRPWASMAIMKQMRQVEIGTHDWVLSRLDEHLRQDYLEKAINGINERYSEYEVHDGWNSRLKSTSLMATEN